MSPFIPEFIGTMLLIILGDGVVANVALSKTKGNNSGWIVIAFGWGLAVFVGAYACTSLGGNGHLNPAVTIAMAYLGILPWSDVGVYIAAQFAGAITGAILVWLAYRKHFEQTEDGNSKLGVFCNAPAIHSPFDNLVTEAVATFVLVFGALLLIKPSVELGTINALPIGLVVLAIGLSLGGPTGYAINPARDLGPRIAHFILPIPQKRDSDWGYAWIPVVGPIAGGLLAAVVHNLIKA